MEPDRTHRPHPSAGTACLCGLSADGRRVLAYGHCCGRYLLHWDVPAPHAEALMRSRYTAFVLARRDYLLATWHVRTRPPVLALEPGGPWLGLEVRGHRVDAHDPARAEVEFVARRRDATGRAYRLHERSRFVRENGRWYYVDGDLL